MSRFDSATVATTAFVSGVVLIALTGCAQISDVFGTQQLDEVPLVETPLDG
jgi:hypothetical protein